MSVPTITLNDGVQIPQLGFGVWQVDAGTEAEEAVARALDAGYRHIDTAQMYGNEESVGKAIAKSGIARGELFVTTKLNNDRHGRQEAQKALDESLAKLGLDQVDLYLIHWPQPKRDAYVDTWRGFEEAKAAGKTRSIGVSNFQIPHLDRLAAETDTVPSVNQIEVHPDFGQAVLRAYHRDHGIATEAWSPLGQGGPLLQDGVVLALAEKYGRTPAQIVLRWHIQLGNIVFPKSVTPSRIVENFDVFGFELADDDVATLTGLDAGNRIGPDPDTFG
ncbi:aldo/keto reductase [Pseudonocardia oroxyli]|uniref:2,5-diketo-D-gluconate reductase A n=1 Tax=Pseudonocardia oroxyli TaxID=366584 RepID=A0A1G7G212_PSEOR|nr:aldo/keto reductase [Pseudonocardia oroxyli]SDE82178.1 2,5-diketo-D-gluconate reductase A [Pseudonocardia oroxyli]